MIFNLLKTKCDETSDTGTYADGAFDAPAAAMTLAPRRIGGHLAHQRDYGSDRTVAPLPARFC
ncbi:hypothetical protein [Rhizobium sp. Root482]|jgi:hypothetical protein|uniref:hypothetical protein n=1 Tax=Rhizobium sp. Root482 TaxID=1736543 RepID=UPI0006F36F88|nr:hypothetical protein [Rhizobium sp. Root482]KQY13395.1 hypothetical protein ASD31_14630 [Rhizobium sp. Root482]